MHFARTLVAAITMACATAQAFELKGITLGAAATACPDGSITKPISSIDTSCHLGPTTLGGATVTYHLLHIHDGKVYSVFFSLAQKGQNANGELAEALMQKFGRPSTAKPHINQYTWDAGQQTLVFDGWRGTVLMMDMAVAQRVRAEHARMKQSDL